MRGRLRRGGQVLGDWGIDCGVDRVVSEPRRQIGEWAQAAWCEGI